MDDKTSRPQDINPIITLLVTWVVAVAAVTILSSVMFSGGWKHSLAQGIVLGSGAVAVMEVNRRRQADTRDAVGGTDDE